MNADFFQFPFSAAPFLCPMAPFTQQLSPAFGRIADMEFFPEGLFLSSKTKACAFFGASVETLDKWIAKGLISPYKRGRVYFFSISGLVQAMNDPRIMGFIRKKRVELAFGLKRKSKPDTTVKYWVWPYPAGKFMYVRIRYRGINIVWFCLPSVADDQKELEGFISDVITFFTNARPQSLHLMKKFKDMEKFSYFKKGVTKKAPAAEATLGKIYAMIRSFRLKELTEQIRAGLAEKTEVLPCVTFSGTFKPRCDEGLKAYSSLICMDLDHLDFPYLLRDRICWDRFLNPCLIFISPRGQGLKIVVRVKDGIPGNHGSYFDAIALYLREAYDITIDSSGRNISRLCLICHDPEPFFFEDGLVESEALLKLLPSREARPCVSAESPAAAYLEAIHDKKNKSHNRDAQPCVSTSDQPSNLLNRMDSIHCLAVDALIRHGWQKKTPILWTRPGKPVKEGHSATYSLYGPDGIYFLTNFSSNAPHFSLDKSYTDVGIICELDYNGDFKKCIAELAGRYLKFENVAI
jgi:hypothetical protein